MNNKHAGSHNNYLVFGIPLLIILTMILIAKTSLFQINSNALATGITFDLLLTLPIVYFLLIRKTNIPKTTIIPLLILAIVICSAILPLEHQFYLNLFKIWILPIVELTVLSFVIYNVRKAIKSFKLKKDASVDFFTTLKSTCYEILPENVVMPLVTEIAVFYYGFIYWKKRKLNVNEFSYHKNSGTIIVLIAIIFIVAIETFVLHKLLVRWSHLAAWILTFLSIYSGIQIFGFLKSMVKRPILIENQQLLLRYGIMTETIIDTKDIESIEITSKDLEKNKETRKLSLLGDLESHNMVIRLKKENTLVGLYGIKRKYKNLAIYVDDKHEFLNQINNLLQPQH